MIYLIHGPDIVSSRNFLTRLREQYQAVTVIDVKKTKKDFELPTSDLFQEKQLLIIENELPKNAEQVIPKIEFDTIIWLPNTLENIPTWVDKENHFKPTESSATFKLADLVFAGSEKHALLFLEKLFLDNIFPEIVIGSLVRNLRQVALSLDGESSEISKSSFVQKKTEELAKHWSRKKLRLGALLLLKADLSIKKGLLPSRIILPKLIVDLCSLAKT
jgi:DNA polymerase III delta subunit